MTPLKPIENRRVRAVLSDRYPLNKVCAHPECKAEVRDPHHCFPRSQIAGDSWFVEITEDEDPAGIDPGIPSDGQRARYAVIPHVTGLCREHHNDVEAHYSWIKLEEGVFVWYDSEKTGDDHDFGRPARDDVEAPCYVWTALGPLNPQPGSVEGKPKRERYKGIAARPSEVWSIKTPKDVEENGPEVLNELLELAREKLERQGLPVADKPKYHVLVPALYAFVTSPAQGIQTPPQPDEDALGTANEPGSTHGDD